MLSRLLVKSLTITVAILAFCNTTTLSQQFVVRYTVSNQDVGFKGYSSDLADDIAQQRVRQINALYNMHYSDYRREVSRFDRRLMISANVVKKMDAKKNIASKYPHADLLYKRSLKQYKQLEEVSEKAAANSKQNKPISSFQEQQEKIIEKALDDYHRAEELIDLGENKTKYINDGAQRLSSVYDLSATEKAELKKEIDKIRFAENQIKKLKQSTGALKNSKNDLERKAIYQTVAQSVVTLSKIMQKVVEAFNPNKNANEAIKVGQAVSEKFIEEYIEKGKSADVAISEAFQKGYEKLRQEELLKKTPAIKEIAKIPLLADDLAKEIERWDKIDKNQRQTLNKIDEVLKSTEDGIKLNENIIKRSKVKYKAIIERSISQYLNKTKLP